MPPARDSLSQEEVETLLGGMASGKGSRRSGRPVEKVVRPYDLAKHERIIRGRMPTLEIINERFARLLRIGLFNFMRRNPDVVVGPVRVLKYSEFINELAVPTNLNVVQVKPLRGAALFVFEPSLVRAVVDSLFGGDGRFKLNGGEREFTPTEQRLIRRLLDVVCIDYKKSWAPVHPLEFEYVRSEMHTQFVNIATASEVVVTTNFKIELGHGGGQFSICIPYATLEPIRDVIYSTMLVDNIEPDQRWLRTMSSELQNVEVELVATLARIPVTFKQLIEMRAGDVMTFELDKTVSAEVDGVPVLECRYGVMNRRYALKVERSLAHTSDSEEPTGDSHE
jgi:flagellar motor switch protein FliM